MSSEKPLILYTGRTPNGYKVSVYLEELKETYGGPEYECALDLPIPNDNPKLGLVYLALRSGKTSRRSRGSSSWCARRSYDTT